MRGKWPVKDRGLSSSDGIWHPVERCRAHVVDGVVEMLEQLIPTSGSRWDPLRPDLVCGQNFNFPTRPAGGPAESIRGPGLLQHPGRARDDSDSSGYHGRSANVSIVSRSVLSCARSLSVPPERVQHNTPLGAMKMNTTIVPSLLSISAWLSLVVRAEGGRKFVTQRGRHPPRA